MSSLSVPSLALLVLQGTASNVPSTGVGDAPGEIPRHGSAYVELAATRDTSPYAEVEVPRVPWSYGQSYRGWDSLDMLAELVGAAPPAGGKAA
jgi:hypothetical protein